LVGVECVYIMYIYIYIYPHLYLSNYIANDIDIQI